MEAIHLPLEEGISASSKGCAFPAPGVPILLELSQWFFNIFDLLKWLLYYRNSRTWALKKQSKKLWFQMDSPNESNGNGTCCKRRKFHNISPVSQDGTGKSTWVTESST